MLKSLQIENYALIEKLGINFGEGLTVITGETGAGKSILMGALSLILGQRADIQMLSDTSRKCIIEGVFDITMIGLAPLFGSYDLDYDDLSVFRREISPQGKSRAFVNDTPVTLSVLKELSEKIIDIHSQHQNLLIGEASFQFDVIDSFSGNLTHVNSYRDDYHKLVKHKRRLSLLEDREQRSKADLDYYIFQYEELERSGLDQEQYMEWESEMVQIRHAAEIKMNLEQAALFLSGGEMNLLGMLLGTLQQIRPLSKYSQTYKILEERLDSLLIEMKDLSRDVEDLSDKGLHDPGRASELETKLDLINKLFLKHRVKDVAALESIRDDYKEKIRNAQTLEDQIDMEKKAVSQMEGGLMEAAQSISEKRKQIIPVVEGEVMRMLKDLGMPGANIKIIQQRSEGLTSNGIDKIQFMFSANLGGELREISRVASGGELSRLMLCIKSLISQKNLLPSIIFDEIDTGISGEIGGKIANILNAISGHMQVIAITHLPQIAATGRQHLLVYKTIDNGKTRTQIKPLDKKERIQEVATMLGGTKPTESMVKTAEELLNFRIESLT